MKRTPYTLRGLSRSKCAHCGLRASAQWRVDNCAAAHLQGVYFPLCERCDAELNRQTLEFFRVPGAEKLMREYASSE